MHNVNAGSHMTDKKSAYMTATKRRDIRSINSNEGSHGNVGTRFFSPKNRDLNRQMSDGKHSNTEFKS